MKRMLLFSLCLFLLFLTACAQTQNDNIQEDLPPLNGENIANDGAHTDPTTDNDDSLDESTPNEEDHVQDEPSSDLEVEEETNEAEDEDTPIEEAPAPEATTLRLTREELAQFDGRQGRRAIIAVNGILYEVTNSSRWFNGNHNGYQAGQDLTDAILGVSPHGIRVLDNIPEVGILID